MTKKNCFTDIAPFTQVKLPFFSLINDIYKSHRNTYNISLEDTHFLKERLMQEIHGSIIIFDNIDEYEYTFNSKPLNF